MTTTKIPLATDPQVNVPSSAWRNAGDETDPRARLLATLQVDCSPVGSVLLHLEAVAVDETPHARGKQSPADGSYWTGSDFDAVAGAVGVGLEDGPWDTLTIRGREYVLIATPFC